jgi:hypothetical protein
MQEELQQRMEEHSAHGKPLLTRAKEMDYAELFHAIIRNSSLLGRKEAELIKNEFQEGITAEMLMTRRIIIGAAIITLGACALMVALILALGAWMAPWLAAAIIGPVFVGFGLWYVTAAWKHHVTLAEVEKELWENLKWSTKTAK